MFAATLEGVPHLPVVKSPAAGNPGIPLAARMARTIASAITSAAKAPILDTDASPENVPMAKENTVSRLRACGRGRSHVPGHPEPFARPW